jgi:DNA mismatch endonuclease (patch repair protein)
MDNVSKAARSKIMRAIKSKGTGPELAVLAALRKAGLQVEANVARLPGTPDAVVTAPGPVWSRGIAVFVNGCYWHGHPHTKVPKTNVEYWLHKIDSNRRRDARVVRKLHRRGWSVITIWECRLDAGIRRAVREAKRRGWATK